MKKYLEQLTNRTERFLYIKDLVLPFFQEDRVSNYFVSSFFTKEELATCQLFCVSSLEMVSELLILTNRNKLIDFIKEVLNLPFYESHNLFLNKAETLIRTKSETETKYLKDHLHFFLEEYSEFHMLALFYFLHENLLKNQCSVTILSLFETVTNDYVHTVRSKKGPEEEELSSLQEFVSLYTPERIYQYLNQSIVGQEQAKRDMSVMIYLYMKKIANPELNLEKHNILMTGPSGCGKTEIIRTLKKFLPIPVVIYDVSALTDAGYKGDNRENLLRSFLGTSKPKGIVFLDEFDKLCGSNAERFSQSVQGQLLSIVEGTELTIEEGMESFCIDTSDLLFIAGGAFEFLRKETKNIGFGKQTKKMEELSMEVLLQNGLRTELAGRFSSVVPFYPLSIKELQQVSRKILKEYEVILGVPITISDRLLTVAFSDSKTGCRWIRYQFDQWLKDVIFTLASKPHDMKAIRLVCKNGTCQVQYERKKETYAG